MNFSYRTEGTRVSCLKMKWKDFLYALTPPFFLPVAFFIFLGKDFNDLTLLPQLDQIVRKLCYMPEREVETLEELL